MPKLKIVFYFSEQPSILKIFANGIHYYLLKQTLNANKARNFCGSRFPKGDLAEIDTTEKLEAIKQLYINNFGLSKKFNS